MATNRLTQLPFSETLLECTISTRVLAYRDVRRLQDIRDIIASKGFRFCNDNIDSEKREVFPNWWNDVEAMSLQFRWDKFCLPSPPGVKIHGGTLEFQDGCHRAIALAAASLFDPSVVKPVEVLLHC